MKLNKKQKRTATIASMAALLAVVLGMGGQTFAKYIETGGATAQATVAKWGVVINTNASELFGTDYTSGNIVAAPTGNSVSTNGTSDVVAPGTNGKVTFGVTGEPEVSTEITFAVTGEAIGIYNGSAIVYEPILWTLKHNDVDVVDAVDVKLEVLKTKVAALSGKYGPKHNFGTDRYEISWEWPFTTTGNDDNDTKLGDNAGTNDATYKTTFNFGLSISVTQTEVNA